MCWGKDGAENVGVTNWWLAQLEILILRGSLPQRPRREPNTTGKSQWNDSWWYSAIFIDWCLSQLLSEAYPAIDGNTSRDPQPNIRGNLRNPVRGEKMDCRSQQDQEHTRKFTESTNLAHRSSKRLNQHQPGSLHGTDLGPLLICYSCVAWSLRETPKWEQGCLWFHYLLLRPTPPTRLLHLALRE